MIMHKMAMNATPSTEVVRIEQRTCDCGCAQPYPSHVGLLRYGASETVFEAALMHGEAKQPHLWVLLGTGPWFDDDSRDCWLTVHAWLDDGNILTSIADPSGSPFTDEDACGGRWLSREDVLAQEGALEWAIARRLQLVAQVPAIALHLGAEA